MELKDLPTVMSVREAAEFLRVSEPTFRNEVTANKVKYIKIGRQIRIIKADLEEYMENKKNEN